jgi:hypothetical protein
MYVKNCRNKINKSPKIEDIPAMCKEKIVKSIEEPLWYVFEANGG